MALLLEQAVHGANPANPNVVGDGVLRWMEELLRQLRDKTNEILNIIRDRLATAIENIVNSISSIITILSTKLSDLITTIREKINDFTRSIVEVLSNVAVRISDVIDKLINRLSKILNDLGDIFSRIVDVIKERMALLAETLRSFLSTIVGKITTVFQGLTETLHEITEKMTNRIKGIIEGIEQRVSSFVETAVTRIITTVTNWVNKLVTLATKIYENVETAIRQFLAKVFIWLHDMTGRATLGAQCIVELGKLIWSKIAEGAYGEALKIVDMFFEGLGVPAPLKVVHGIVSTIAFFYLTVQVQFIPTSIAAEMNATAALRPSGIGVETAALAVNLGYMDEQTFERNAARLGISSDIARSAFATLRRFPTPEELGQAFLRHIISESEHDTILRLMGYDDNSIRVKKMLYWVMPSPSDLIRMAVREVFTPEVVEKFKMLEDLPREFVEWGRKIGLDESWVKAYWAAHWDLPSPEMGFEMLHRGIITREDLELLLRALDVMPFWRDKVIQLSYNTYARVDIRRMYQLGVLSEEDVKRSYMDLGYDEEKARRLTEFTTRYYSPDDYTELDDYKKITHSLIIKAYKRGVISRNDALTRLLEIKYSQKDAELLLSIADAETFLDTEPESRVPKLQQTIELIRDSLKRKLISELKAKELLSSLGLTSQEANWYIALAHFEVEKETDILLVDIARHKYVERTWSRETTMSFLNQLNIAGASANELLELWDIERLASFKKPTEAQFRAALHQGVISLDEYSEELRGLGYDEKYVQMLTKLTMGGKK